MPPDPDLLPKPCAVGCGRMSRGFGIYMGGYAYSRLIGPRLQACSMRCLNLLTAAKRGTLPMIDPTEDEIAAIENASNYGGEFLDSIGAEIVTTGTPDGLTAEQWMEFIEAVCTGYVDHLNEIASAREKALEQPT